MSQLLEHVIALHGTNSPASGATMDYLRRRGLGRLADALARHNARIVGRAG